MLMQQQCDVFVYSLSLSHHFVHSTLQGADYEHVSQFSFNFVGTHWDSSRSGNKTFLLVLKLLLLDLLFFHYFHTQ